MVLTSEQQQKVANWLRDKLGPRGCPSCGQLQGFSVGALIAAPTVMMTQEGMAVDLGNSVPLIPLACQHCGNVRFFSATIMGLVPQGGQMNAAIDGGSFW